MNDIIKIGDRVHSYDFPDLTGMKTSCYVEGIVEAIGQVPAIGGCDRYTIRITRRVWKGHEDDGWKNGKEFPDGYAYPPVNGSQSWLGGVTGCVKLLPPEPVPQPADPTLFQASATRSGPSLKWRQVAQGRVDLLAKLEKYLRDCGWPFVRVDEAKKAIFDSSQIKSFDFIIYSSTGDNLLVLVVTRRPTPQQVQQLSEWEKIFGKGFRGSFVFQADNRWLQIGLADLQAIDVLEHALPLEQFIMPRSQTNERSAT